VILRFGRAVLITPKRLEKVEALARRLNGIVAGPSRMSWRLFLLFNALGAAPWVGFWSGLSYFVRHEARRFRTLFHKYALVFVAALVVAAIVVLVRMLKRHRE
jgi:membrane protein DedA with SNARE-associated domain